MQQTALIRLLGAGIVAGALLTGCSEGGPIEENVVRPGITAMEQASALACSSDAQTMQLAIDTFEAMEGRLPKDEAELVGAGFNESERYDVVNGQVVPVAVDCGGTGAAPPTVPPGSAPMTAPSTDVGEIVTSTEPPLTPEQMLAEFTPEEIAEVGGAECAGELASLFVASQNYVAEQGTDPETIEELAGYLDQPIELWVVQDGGLAAAPGSGCINLDDSPPDQAARCQSDAITLAVAREAYLAQFGTGTEPTQADLVAAQMLRAPFHDVDLSAGAVVAVAGGPCDGVDLGV